MDTAAQTTPYLSRCVQPVLVQYGLIKLLTCYLAVGMFFMLVPGTLLGVCNLLEIGRQQVSTAVSSGWIQAHGHALVFGWVGTFIMGIGLYCLPPCQDGGRQLTKQGLLLLWLWAIGVALRWMVCMYQWHWRILLPVSAFSEIAGAFLFLYLSMKGHRSQRRSGKLALPAIMIIAGTAGLLCTLVLNLTQAIELTVNAASPIAPANQSRLVVCSAIWSFVIPVVCGLSAKWLPLFAGMKSYSSPLMSVSLGFLVLGVTADMVGLHSLSAALTMLFSVNVCLALRIFQTDAMEPVLAGVHRSFSGFVRLSFLWLLVSSGLGLSDAIFPDSAGLGGAARHAVTVGFITGLVLSIGPRLLPGLLGRSQIYSREVMLSALCLIHVGCLLRVVCQPLAYQNQWLLAWHLLPASAILELLAICLFVSNILLTLSRSPAEQEPVRN